MMIECAPPVCTAATRREFLAILAAAGLLSGCAGGTTGAPGTTGGATSRRIEQRLGVTDVPEAPARVVAIDRRGTPPHLLAFGITPVGALTHESIGPQFPGVVADLARDVTVLPTAGSSDEVRLEAIQYDALSRIAPTVAVDIDVHDAEPSLRAIAAAVGRDEQADTIIGEFDALRAQRIAALGEIGTVSAVLGVGDQIQVYRPQASSVTRWLQDAGGRIVPDTTGLAGERYRDLFVTVGPELLGEVNGDTLIVMANSGADGEAALSALSWNPLWSGLPAVRAGRVIRLNSQESVGYFGYQGYAAVLDSLAGQWVALAPCSPGGGGAGSEFPPLARRSTIMAEGPCKECGRYGPLVRLLAYAGLRWGEAAALGLRDVDLQRRRIQVVASVTEVNGHLVWGTPRTHARRTVPVPRFLAADLAPLVTGRDANAFLFRAPRGGVLRVRNFRRNIFDPAVNKIGPVGFHPHELRHTAASLAIASGTR